MLSSFDPCDHLVLSLNLKHCLYQHRAAGAKLGPAVVCSCSADVHNLEIRIDGTKLGDYSFSVHEK